MLSIQSMQLRLLSTKVYKSCFPLALISELPGYFLNVLLEQDECELGNIVPSLEATLLRGAANFNSFQLSHLLQHARNLLFFS